MCSSTSSSTSRQDRIVRMPLDSQVHAAHACEIDIESNLPKVKAQHEIKSSGRHSPRNLLSFLCSLKEALLCLFPLLLGRYAPFFLSNEKKSDDSPLQPSTTTSQRPNGTTRRRKVAFRIPSFDARLSSRDAFQPSTRVNPRQASGRKRDKSPKRPRRMVSKDTTLSSMA